MIGSTLGYEGLGSLMLYMIGDQPPDRDEWKGYIEALKERVARHGRARLVVMAGTGTPDAVQRRQLGESAVARKLRAAVVTDNLLARGVVTAFRWYGLDLSAFKTSAVADAYRFVSATPEEVEWLTTTTRRLREALYAPRASARF